jgi:hypothetical protein
MQTCRASPMSEQLESPTQTGDYKGGLAKGVVMTDDEAIRFCNGMIAALSSHILTPAKTAKGARVTIPGVMDLLANEGLCAFVGHAGTPIIRPI